MRINLFVAQATGLSRRAADQAIAAGRITVNGQPAQVGNHVTATDVVTLDGRPIIPLVKRQTITLNKPAGYVCSRVGQGSQTIYDLLPPELHNLKPVGRLDKDSSGLLLLTNDGKLAHKLTHPSFSKQKIYAVELNKPLTNEDFMKVTQSGVNIGDNRASRFQLKKPGNSHRDLAKHSDKLIHNSAFLVTISEGRNRQIRRTFAALGYRVTRLHRIQFGPYQLPPHLKSGQYTML